MIEEENNIIEITDEDGNVIKCELFDMVEFKDEYYALLVEEGHSEDDEPEVILMHYKEDGEDVYFESIEDEEEFNAVSEYIQSLSEDFDEDEE